MKLPSIQQIADESLRTLLRFPFVLAVAAAGTVAAIVIAEQQFNAEPDMAFRVLYSALLGVPFLIGLALFAEKRRWRVASSAGLQAIGVLLLVAYAWSLPGHVTITPQIHIIRLMMLVVGMHLFVTVAAWQGRSEINGFWHFNKTLFLRLLTASLFTLVLYTGLAIALAAVENLFEVNVPGERYAQLWFILTGMFMTWFFLAGVPEDFDALDSLEEYPKGLKVFAQYVLLPLVVIYLLILTAYSGKIIIEWSWPYGWVSRLILGFAASGMFFFLLLHPIRERGGNRWILKAFRWFFITLAPLLVMYFLAVMRRLSDYGLTENRYLAIVLGVWLAAMTLYFLFSRGKSIKIIPLTLCVLTFLVSFGPWGAFAVSERSQVSRLQDLLKTNGMFSGEKAQAAKAPVTHADAIEISAALLYLHDVHGYSSLQPWFDEPLRQDTLGMNSEWKDPSHVTGILGIEYVLAPRIQPGGNLIFETSRKDVMIVSGYGFVLPEDSFNAKNENRTVTLGDASYRLNSSLDTLTFLHAPPAQPGDTVVLPLGEVASTLLEKYHDLGAVDIPLELTGVETSGSRLKVKVYVLRLTLRKEDGRLITENIRLRVMYGNTTIESSPDLSRTR